MLGLTLLYALALILAASSWQHEHLPGVGYRLAFGLQGGAFLWALGTGQWERAFEAVCLAWAARWGYVVWRDAQQYRQATYFFPKPGRR